MFDIFLNIYFQIPSYPHHPLHGLPPHPHLPPPPHGFAPHPPPHSTPGGAVGQPSTGATTPTGAAGIKRSASPLQSPHQGATASAAAAPSPLQSPHQGATAATAPGGVAQPTQLYPGVIEWLHLESSGRTAMSGRMTITAVTIFYIHF